ncbi:hypothetical protein [Bacillus sp. S/N-304-OC-R1]|uniref:hypothetical protein n=1 Tax=Bacillus sp. S/N-304-OC-R1 TaxID=2758034 RepID=UPI001C8E758A|nr:hypothetical protein [Bacillus sp. S/N-304-OC-R1]MBY0120525.1 hypothetical protein [Bacillus sp. S/N-304-OC-R1]
MGAIMLGPFMIKYEWILYLISGLSAYLMIRFHSKEDLPFQEIFLNSMLNSFLIGFIVYKFSSIIIRPTILIDNPSSIIFTTGGTKGKLLGVIIALLYFFNKYRNGIWPLKNWLILMVYGIVTFFVAFWMFRTLFFLLV